MLDRILRFSIQNKLFIGFLTLLLVIWGIWSARRLPIDAVPDITNNQVQIITVTPTLAGQEVEQLVTFPIEQSIANLPDVEETRSISRFGLSLITVVFKEEVPTYFARQLISEKLKDAVTKIPAGIGTPELAPVSTGLGEVYQYILHPRKGSEGKYTSKDLRTMQDWIVARQLYGTEGIAEVNSFGGELKQYEVAVDPNRLRTLGISIPDIFEALERNNENTGGAYIDKKPNAYFIRGIGIVTSLEDVRNIAIKNATGAVPIFIKDVADVRFGHAIRYGAMTYNGEVDAVGGVVMMLKGANSNEVVKRIKEKIPVIQRSLPEDVTIEPFLDRTDLVDRAISTVETNLIEGALIVIFVLVFFLGNLRAGLIVASAIPLSLLFALGMMNVFGVSANLMSLGAIDFGLIVDGAVIIVEATLHHLALRKGKKRLTQAEMNEEVFQSASKIRNSAAFGEIIILIVYVPILTLQGIEGKMFTPMAKTVGFAILGALLLSVTYIPMMSALVLSKKPVLKETFSDRMMGRLQGLYAPLLARAVRVKYALIGGTVALFAMSLFLFSRMGGEFIPQLQEGDFAFHCILPQGSSLSQSIETSMQASRILRKFDEVKMVVGKTGSAEVPTDPMPPEVSDLVIVLKPPKEWKETKSYDMLANEMLHALEDIPGIFFEANQPIQMRFNELMTGIRQDVAVKIFGENMDTLAAYAAQVSQVIRQVPGATEPQAERVVGLPQINVEYDRARLAGYGLNVADVNDVLSTAFAGKIAGQVFENERRFDLVVRLDSLHRTRIEDVSNLMIPTNAGHQIPLSQIARVHYNLGPAQISREKSQRRIVIGFNVEGRDVQSVVSEIQARLTKEVRLPTGYYFTYGGQFENLQKASSRLLIAVPAALLLIFALLYFTFHSLRQALLIFTAIPMSAIGGVFALLLRGMPFSISAGVGFIALFGVAVLNGIVLIGTFNQLEKEGMADVWQRVVTGARERLRPVLMTATVASFGFLPMALSRSAGAEVQKPLATVVIGGLITATFLTLFVLPLLYLIFHRRRKLMPKNVLAGAVLIGLFAVPTMASAQTSPPVFHSAEEAVSFAVVRNSALRARELEIQAAKSLRRTAIEFPKTELSMQIGQYNSPYSDKSYSISQNLPFPTLFSAQSRLLRAELQTRELQKELTLLELKEQIRNAFYQIRFLQHNRRQLVYLDSLYEDFVRIAQLRYRTGDTRKVDISTAAVRKGEVALQVRQNEVLIQNAYQILNALLQSETAPVVADADSYQPLVLPALSDSTAMTLHPTVRALYAEALVARQRKGVAQALGLPDFRVGYTNQSLMGFHEVNGQEAYYGADRRFSYFHAGIGIPLSFGATRARRQALGLQQEAAETNALRQQRLLEAELQNALRQYQQDLQQFQYYQSQALPNAQELIAAGQLGYRTGDISAVEYLFTLQTATDIQLDYLKSIRQINESVIRIYSLTNQ